MNCKTNHYFVELYKGKSGTKLFLWVCIVILEMLKFENQHMVNICSSDCYDWKNYEVVIMSEGNQHKQAGLVGVGTATFFPRSSR